MGNTMKQRKIIQISTILDHNGNPQLTALCNDGSLWERTPNGDGWYLQKNIPATPCREQLSKQGYLVHDDYADIETP